MKKKDKRRKPTAEEIRKNDMYRLYLEAFGATKVVQKWMNKQYGFAHSSHTNISSL